MLELHKRNLKETVDIMQSSFYKAKFAAEYLQVAIRYAKLNKMVEAWDKGELDFTPTCSREIYDRQLSCMKEYLSILEERANIEHVKLSDYENGMTFEEAMKQLFLGKKIALPELAGYWYLHKDGTVHCFTKDLKDVDTPWYEKYCMRNDWKIYDKVNELQLKEYQESINKEKK